MTQQHPAPKSPWEKAVEQGLAIIEAIDEEVPEWAIERAPEFFEDVREKVASVVERIEREQAVSERQLAALDGWESGVRKWIRD